MRMRWLLYYLILEFEIAKSSYFQLLVPTARESHFFSTSFCGTYMQRLVDSFHKFYICCYSCTYSIGRWFKCVYSVYFVSSLYVKYSRLRLWVWKFPAWNCWKFIPIFSEISANLLEEFFVTLYVLIITICITYFSLAAFSGFFQHYHCTALSPSQWHVNDSLSTYIKQVFPSPALQSDVVK